MARYDGEHKEQTRRRILETAGRRLKSDGIDGSGVKTLMADAGLTNGAFYAHFGSKDDLVAATVADQLRAQTEVLRALPPGAESVRAYLASYLSTGHRDDPASGCPSGALLDEIARSSPAVKAAYTAGLVAMADAMAELLPGLGRVEALQLLATLVGTLQLARSLDDPALSAAVLDGARTALTAQLTPAEDTP